MLKPNFRQSILIFIVVVPLLSIGLGVYDPISSTEEYNNPIRTRVAQNVFNIAELTEETEITVNRSIVVNDWGYVTITELVAIKNSPSFNSFDYSLMEEFYQHVEFFQVELLSENNEEIETSEVNIENSVATWTVSIPPIPDNSSDSYTFQILVGVADTVSKLRDTLTGTEGLPFQFSGANFYPWFNFPITELNVKTGIWSMDTDQVFDNNTYLPKESTVNAEIEFLNNQTHSLAAYTKINEVPKLLQTIGDKSYIPAYKSETANELIEPIQIDISFDNAPIDYLSVESTIEISQWGSVHHTERITMVHSGIEGQNIGGPLDPSGIPIFINAFGLKSFSALDDFGNLSQSTKEFRDIFSSPHAPNITLLTVMPRNSLNPGNIYTFELKYEVRHDYRLEATGNFLTPRGIITTPAMSIFNWTNRDFSLKIIFPSTATINLPESLWGYPVSKANLTSTSGILGYPQPTLKLHFKNFSYYNNHLEKIEYSLMPIIGQIWEPILFMAIIALLGLAIILVRNIGFSVSRATTSTTTEIHIPFELIRGFVINYEEKTALRSRITNLAKKRKNLKKKEFEKQKQTLQNKQIEVDRELVTFTGQLAEQGARYRDAVRALELSEEERDQALSNLQDLESKKKQKRIRTEIYNRLKEDYSRRLRKANGTIERVLVQLRSFLTEQR